MEKSKQQARTRGATGVEEEKQEEKERRVASRVRQGTRVASALKLRDMNV